MLKLYCQSCGAVNAYASEKPNFCQKCGTPTDLSEKAKAKKAPPKQKKAKPQEVDEVEVEDEDGEVSTGGYEQMDGLDFDIDFVKKVDTIGSIVGTGEGSEGPWSDPNKPKVSNEEFLEQFKKEAGTDRTNKEQET